MTYREELQDKLTELINNPIINQDVKSTIVSAKSAICDIDKLEKQKEELLQQQVIILKALIGKNIYWAVPGWKLETHLITGIEYRIWDSDFFDTKSKKYKNTKQILIEIDGDSYYLAANIGINLFFTKEDAMSALQTEVEKYKDNRNEC